MKSKNNLLSDAVHRALFGIAMVGAVGAQAQGADEKEVEEIVITGSRIALDTNLVSTSPVTTVGAQELAYTGVTRVEDLLNDLPQIVPEFTGNDSNGSTGTATLDLRGLGSDRTLVLINGHRMGFGNPFALAPDINQIPANMIERVELLTGGASSTYGSDAVAGVVNFIMKRDFEGFEIDIQKSGYQHDNSNGTVRDAVDRAGFDQAPGDITDGEMTNINVMVGMNSADGRGNVTGYLGYREIKAIRQDARDYSSCALGATGECGGSSTTPLGRFTDFGIGPGVDLQRDPATGDFVPFADLYNYGPLNYFQRPDERYTGGLFGSYEVADNMEAYAEFMFMDDRSLAQIAPSGTFFNNSGLSCGNPLLSTQQFNALGCTSTDDFLPVYVGRRNAEGGPRFDDIQHNSMRSLVGLRGDFNDQWSFDAFVNFARLNYTEVYNNDLSIPNIDRALNVVADPVTGEPVCQSVIDGSDPSCVPYDVFTAAGPSQAAINYLTIPLYSKADLDMSQGVAFVTGDLTDYGIALPTANSGIQIVAGLEYRDDNLTFDLDNNYNQGNAAGQGGATADVSGAVLVKEFFTEARIPLVEDRPGMQSVALDLRYRRSDYDTGVDANTYNIGAEWSVNDDFRFRASYSRAVRAPNINELFAAQTIGLWSGTDPCAGATPSLTEAQCALTGVPAGAYGSVPASPADQYNGLFGGNPNLNEETSDSITVGMVLTPESFIEGLVLTLDYWNITVDDAISIIDPQFAITQCGETGDAAFCDLISRNAVNGNLWVGSGPGAPRVQGTNTNIGKFEVAGFDVNGTYAIDIGNHGLQFALRGTLLDKWDDQPLPGGVINDCVGTWGGACGRPRPEWKHTFSTTWSTPVEGLDVVGAWRYVGEVKEFGQDRLTIDGQNYLDLSASYYLPEALGGQTTIIAGITNILDEDPPVNGLLNTAGFSNGNTIPGTWDPLGRYWFLGLTHSRGGN